MTFFVDSSFPSFCLLILLNPILIDLSVSYFPLVFGSVVIIAYK